MKAFPINHREIWWLKIFRDTNTSNRSLPTVFWRKTQPQFQILLLLRKQRWRKCAVLFHSTKNPQVLQIHPVSTRSLQICIWQLHAYQNNSSFYQTEKNCLPKRLNIQRIKMYSHISKASIQEHRWYFPSVKASSFRKVAKKVLDGWLRWGLQSHRKEEKAAFVLQDFCRMWECALPGDVAAWPNTSHWAGAQLWRSISIHFPFLFLGI